MQYQDDDYGTDYEPTYHDSASIVSAAPGDTSIGDLIGSAWQYTRDNVPETIGGLLLVFGITYGVQMVVTMGIYFAMFAGMMAFAGLSEIVGEDVAGVMALTAGGFGYILLILVMTAANALAMAAYQMLWLKLIRGQEKVNYSAALKSLALPIILASFLVFAATMAGMLAFIVGAYVVAVGLMLTNYIVIDHGYGAKEAVKASWHLMDGHKLQMFVLLMVLGFLNMGGLMACGMGMLVTMPISVGAMALFYTRIARAGNAYLGY